jgi:hypothetical protein
MEAMTEVFEQIWVLGNEIKVEMKLWIDDRIDFLDDENTLLSIEYIVGEIEFAKAETRELNRERTAWNSLLHKVGPFEQLKKYWNLEYERLSEVVTELEDYLKKLRHLKEDLTASTRKEDKITSESDTEAFKRLFLQFAGSIVSIAIWEKRGQITYFPEGVRWDNLDEFLLLPGCVIAGSGLVTLECDLILYKRDACARQMDFILDKVIKGKKSGFIHGPPGTGKSAITFFASCYLSNEWEFYWIDARNLRGLLPVIRIHNGTMDRFHVSVNDIEKSFMESKSLDNPRIVILDSVDIQISENEKLFHSGTQWAMNNQNCRFIAVSSAGGRKVVKRSIDEGVSVFAVGSWDMAGYLKAIKNDKFWSSVERAFPSQETRTYEARCELVERKYFFAGNCARFMFQYTVSEVIEEINLKIGELSSENSDILNAGQLSVNAIHSLTSASINDDFNILATDGFVSRYAARLIGKTCSLKIIDSLASCSILSHNSAARGWVFEATFFARVRHATELRVYTRQKTRTEKRKPLIWECPQEAVLRIKQFDPIDFTKISHDTWLMPIALNNAGYDSAILYTDGLIRFVQVTIAKSHDLKMKSFADLVCRLRELEYTVDRAEIFFVVPNSDRARFFTITRIMESDRFTELFPNSWPKGEDEVRDRIGIVMIDFATQT